MCHQYLKRTMNYLSKNPKLKILSVITGYLPAIGGAQIHTHTLNKELAKRHQVQVVCQWTENRTDFLRGTTVNAPNQAAFVIDGIPVTRISPTIQERRQMRFWVWGYFLLQTQAINQISSVLSKHLIPFANDIDLIHNVRMGREGLSFSGLRVAQTRHLPFVFTPLHHPRWGSWLHRHYQLLYQEADAILALTAWERQKLIEFGVDPHRIVISGIGPVLVAGQNGSTFREQHGLSGPLVLFLGQKYRYKGLGALLAAAKLVWSQMPNVHFACLGPRTAYSKRLFMGEMDKRIIELGIVDLATKSSALQAADVVCIPSNQESFGGVFVEAWSSGSPVIGGDCPALREVITDGKDGFIVQQKADQIADRILRLLGDMDLRSQMVENGREKVNSQYSWDKIAEQTEKAYRIAIKTKTKSTDESLN